MKFFGSKRHEHAGEGQHLERKPSPDTDGRITFRACFMGLVASMGGMIFGYSSGQVSGYFMMKDYGERFGEPNGDGTYNFSAARQGTITGLLSIGCLFGSLIAGSLCDSIGRRKTISISALWTCVGTIIEVASQHAWYQHAIGRLVTGLGVGALSVAVPMYQSESAPAIIRGLIVSCYQLFVTLGIWCAEMVNWGTNHYDGSASWRIPNGLNFLWALLLGVGILLLPESPRFAYRKGKVEEARKTIANLAGLDINSPSVNRQIEDIREKLEEEQALPETRLVEIVTGPRMAYRTVLGITLQAGQQLTGINFFFYFGTTVFASTGLKDSYVTQLILGSVNCACTFGGLYVVQKCGRRKSLMIGAAWMMMCFFVYAFVGHFALDRKDPLSTPAAGAVLVTFSCLAIAAFATTWGPLVWAVVAEMYPSQYRSRCMAIATATNWLFNFLIGFFTRFITDAIDYFYGLVYAGCCAALVAIVFFFVIESKDRTLEEIDTMYVQHVNPITSSKWVGEPHGPKHAREGVTDEEASS
ncbi:major facilitator superfamily transporter [Fusarium tjaetaba]|uniref:Major facilitator superfamily transporter n=1 Tax=Fusarium tjaetaba TaxID=1567544 RepID=A0A8H5VV45_9HYPO|nr:major facilitator superfamily transporter [Fusarium tjaetaba]KAF5636781.1 major facilitator superfamily transporter [Fusarium tjaetaba]